MQNTASARCRREIRPRRVSSRVRCASASSQRARSHATIGPPFRRFQRARSGVCLKSPAGPPVTHQRLGSVLSAGGGGRVDGCHASSRGRGVVMCAAVR